MVRWGKTPRWAKTPPTDFSMTLTQLKFLDT